MTIKVIIFSLLIVSIYSITGHNAGDKQEEREFCNLIANPTSLLKDENDSSSKPCLQSRVTSSDKYQCCFESYRMLSTMTYACKWIEWKNEDSFNEEKDLLKSYNAKNITIKCDNASYSKISYIVIALITFLLF